MHPQPPCDVHTERHQSPAEKISENMLQGCEGAHGGRWKVTAFHMRWALDLFASTASTARPRSSVGSWSKSPSRILPGGLISVYHQNTVSVVRSQYPSHVRFFFETSARTCRCE